MSDGHTSYGAFGMGLSTFILGFGLKELTSKSGSTLIAMVLLSVFLAVFVGFALISVRERAAKKDQRQEVEEHVKLPLPDKVAWMWIFLSSETVFFTMLIGLSFALRLTVDEAFGLTDFGTGWLGHYHGDLEFQGWVDAKGHGPTELLNLELTTLNTFLLIVSSYTMVLAVEQAKLGDNLKTRNRLLLTALIGLIFLSVQVTEYTILITQEKFTPESGLFGATFYLQTGFHGAHVLIGIVLLLIMAYKAHLNYFTKEDNSDVEVLGLYWHFVDLVWIILFTVVYLI